jgi:glucose-6-phosphate 1-dehydrogenase
MISADAFVFFGATGDLAYKQVFPALQSLIKHGQLDLPIICVAKSGWNLDRLKSHVHDSLQAHGGIDPRAYEQLLARLQYIDGDYQDANTFTQLRTCLKDAKRPVHYLAIPPALFSDVVLALGRSECARGASVIVEKPFGHDQKSAAALHKTLRSIFPEDSVFRLDHYLGKEQIQNIVYFRFGDACFEPLWNRNHVAHIQITMAENFGVKGRGRFYDATGAIRDVLQNHLLMLTSILTMDAPDTHTLDGIRMEQARLLRAIRPIAPGDMVRGQYHGYREEEGVDPRSTTETFFATRLFVDSWRWADVPIFIRSGKSLPETFTEAIVTFRKPPIRLFDDVTPAQDNYLRFRVTPTGAIALGVRLKKLGQGMTGEPSELIANENMSEAMAPYERLLVDALRGDQILFAREDEVEAAWNVVDQVLANPPPVQPYEPNAWGPKAADELPASVGGWRTPTTDGRST